MDNSYQIGIRERLERAITQELHTNRTAFAHQIGLDPSNFAKMCTGKLVITKKTLNLISQNSSINTEWLISGEGEPIRKAPVLPNKYLNNVPAKPRILNMEKIGTSDLSEDGTIELMPEIEQFPEYDFTITIHGKSMEPTFHTGDELAVKDITDSKFLQWGAPHVLKTKQGLVIKKIYYDEEHNGYKCVSDNEQFPAYTVPQDEVLRIYKIVGLIRCLE